MGVSKVEYNNETLIDVSNDTVTPSTLAEGVTAHDSNGDLIVGTMNPEGGSSSGSGIIDVTELPTSGIDENAVYRLTETVQTEKTQIYFTNYISDSDTILVNTVYEYFTSLGVPTIPNVYVVDDISNMLETDIQTFSAIHLYILRNNGVVYANVPIYGGTITCGLFGWQDLNHDRGFTENVYNEKASGVYTTLETFKDVVRYFVRKNGEWKEITAYTHTINSHGFDNFNMLSGDITSKIFSIVDIITGDCAELDENWFLKRNGEYYSLIRSSLFRGMKFRTVTIPRFIKSVGTKAFEDCFHLETVTFKGVVNFLDSAAFSYCNNLTTINVPWAEGEVGGAPWGATNATINYNYTEG